MSSSNPNRTLGLGILIILAGLFILLNQLDLLSPTVANVFISWQMLLIAIGLYNVLFSESRVFGFILIVVGGFFLLPEIFTLPYNFRRNFWPVLLILVGIFILFKAGVLGNRNSMDRSVVQGELEFFDEVNIFSGSEKKINYKNFKGGKITSIFGGSDIDLTGSEMAPGKNVLEVFYMFGGSSIRVPHDWVVVNNVTAILGGFSDKRTNPVLTDSGAEKVLVIQGLVIFGGGEIKS